MRGGDPYDRDVVLKALVRSVSRFRDEGRRPDLVFASGDIAHSGKAPEYDLAGKFFDDLLLAAGIEKSRLFVIPGNHDVDRDYCVGLARTLGSREEADTYFHPDHPKAHMTLKLGAFLEWHNRYFEGVRSLANHTTCGPVDRVEVNGRRLAILPINSALFCQDDNDHDKLWVGRRCLDAALDEMKAVEADLRIALIHHPLEWLSTIENSNIEAALEESIDVLLRGHLHEARVDSVASAEVELLRCAAGAAYQSRKWPNRAFYVGFDGSNLTFYPIRYEDVSLPVWTTDPSVFPHDRNHERSFPIARLTREHKRLPSGAPSPASAPPRFRSNISSRGNLPFVGREELLAQIAACLENPTAERVVVLHGQPGVGKSELAREFARIHRDRYSGGTFQVDASTDAIAIHLATIGKNILDLDFPSDVPLNDQGERAFHRLGVTPTLLIYDNVVDYHRTQPWLPLSGMPCHVLITTLLDPGILPWTSIEVKPLSRVKSLELVEKMAGSQFTQRYGGSIADGAGGLPVQIVPVVATLAYEQRRGRDPAPGAGIASSAADSFRTAYQRLEQPARMLLHAAALLNPHRIPAAELSQHVMEGIGWSFTDYERALDACRDHHLLEGTPDPSMHQLFAAFLRKTAPSEEDQKGLKEVRAVQWRRFAALAESVSENPADTLKATALISYPLSPEGWSGLEQPPSIEAGSAIGRALYEIGRFEEARPWYERAVAEKEKGDVHGRIDHESLGMSIRAFHGKH